MDESLAVDAQGVTKTHGSLRAVDDISVRVAAGEVYGVLGPNGAGKTTFLRMLFGLIRPDAGTIRVFGKTWEDSGVGVLDGVAGFIESPRFYPYLTGRANLEGLALLDGGTPNGLLEEVLDVVEMSDRADQKDGGCSYGMRQRLGVAASLLREPRLLVLDEPANGLDPAGIRDMRALVKRLADRGLTVLLSSHDMGRRAPGLSDQGSRGPGTGRSRIASSGAFAAALCCVRLFRGAGPIVSVVTSQSIHPAAARAGSRNLAFVSGAAIGVLGGMIGLGGAEFRLPLLIGAFGFVALQAVIMNKALSLVVVVTALPARLLGVPITDVAEHWTIIVNLLAGSLVGAWLGATWATRMRSRTLYRVLAVLLVLIAVTLVLTHLGDVHPSGINGGWQVVAGAVAGVAIGVVAALMGVAGGELLIPTIVLLYAVDIKIAGSLSLAVSLPTMLVAFARYSRDQSFQVLAANKPFLIAMAAGSVAGTVAGGLLLNVVPSMVLIPLLAALLVLSSVKVWQHE